MTKESAAEGPIFGIATALWLLALWLPTLAALGGPAESLGTTEGQILTLTIMALTLPRIALAADWLTRT